MTMVRRQDGGRRGRCLEHRAHVLHEVAGRRHALLVGLGDLAGEHLQIQHRKTRQPRCKFTERMNDAAGSMQPRSNAMPMQRASMQSQTMNEKE